MADNHNLDSTAEALDALMKIKASSSPSLSSIREQSRVNPDAASILNSSTSCDSMANTLNTDVPEYAALSGNPILQKYNFEASRDGATNLRDGSGEIPFGCTAATMIPPIFEGSAQKYHASYPQSSFL